MWLISLKAGSIRIGRSNFSLIREKFDSTCNYPQVLEQGSSLAAQHGYGYWYVECKVDDIDLLDQQLRARPPIASQQTAVDCPPAAAQAARAGEDARALFAKWIESPRRPDDRAIVVDSRGNPEMLCDEIMKQIVDQLSHSAEPVL